MTRIGLSVEAANLHRSVGSTSTCTSATVESLKARLLPQPFHTSHEKRSKPRKSRLAPTRPLKAGNAMKQKRDSVTICEDSVFAHNVIKAEERLALATSIVNDVLKALTDAAKKPTYRSPRRPKLLVRRMSGSVSETGAPPCQTPLQPISANQNTTPSRRGEKRLSWTHAESEYHCLRAQAQCARIGFACLRTLQAQERKINFPYLQLEMGMSALIHKFIALGFYDLAVKELRILRRRLLSLNENGSEAAEMSECNSKHAYKDSDSSPQSLPLVELLGFHGINDRGLLLSLITTTQLQILRIIGTTGTDDVGKLVRKLQLDQPGCPTLLIQQLSGTAQEQTKEKAGHQLEMLAQLLLKICHKVLPECTSKGNKFLAESVFHLRLIALVSKARWWEVSGHTLGGPKSLFTPFAENLEDYRQRSGASEEDVYCLAKKAFATITNLPQTGLIHGHPSLTRLYLLLADLAQAAGQSKDVSSWLVKATGSMDDAKASQLQRCIVACQLATMQLRASSICGLDMVGIEPLKKAAESLKGDLHGESAMLDELLAIVLSLRKSASAVILRSRRESDGAEAPSSHRLITECLQLLALSMRFIVRYLGNPPCSGVNDEKFSRYKHRLNFVSPLMPSIVEAVTTIGRVYAKYPTEKWEPINATLQDCIKLATSLEGSALIEETQPNNGQSPFVMISHSYWCRYSSLKRLSADVREQQQWLQASIDLIQKQGSDVQMASSLLLKLEHCGMLHEKAQDPNEALKVYEEALQVHINLGVVAKAAEAAMTSSLAIAFDQDEDVRLLARILLAYLRVASKLRESSPTLSLYFDPGESPIRQRVLLLGYQYSAIVSKLLSRSSATLYHNSIHGLSETLFSLCSKDEFAVQRLHLVVQGLYLRTTYPASFEGLFLPSILDEHYIAEILGDLRSDLGLHQYTSHLVNTLKFLVEIDKDKPNLKALEETLRSWFDLSQKCPDLTSLRLRVYDITSWVLHLELVLGYLEAQGLDYLKALALQVATKVHESSAITESFGIASKWTDLGIQYIRLGYSGLAGVILQRAQQFLQNADPSVTSLTNITWHLASADLALETHNYSKCNDHLQALREEFRQGYQYCQDPQFSGKHVQLRQIAADVDMIQSRLAAAEGRSYEALLFGRLGVKSYHQSWSVIERRQSKICAATSSVPRGSANESLTESLPELSLAEEPYKQGRCKHAALQSAPFWHLVPRLFKGLLHLSRLFAHNGLYPEANHYLKQSRKIAEAVNTSAWLSQYLLLEARYATRLGNESEALDLLLQASENIDDKWHRRTFVTLQTRLAVCYARKGQRESGDVAATLAGSALRQIRSREYLDNLLQKQHITDDLDLQIRKLTIDQIQPVMRSRPKNRAAISTGNAKTGAATKVMQPLSEQLPKSDVLALFQMEATTCRELAAVALSNGDLEIASNRFEEAHGIPNNLQYVVLRAVTRAEFSLQKGLREIERDPVFSIVLESAISHPSISGYGQCSASKAITSDACKHSQPTRKLLGKATVKSSKRNDLEEERGYIKYLMAAKRTVTDILSQAQTLGSTNSLYHAMDVLSRVVVILSALTSPGSGASDSATFASYTIELGRMISMFRECQAIHVERRIPEITHDCQQLLTATVKEQPPAWSLGLTDFQTLYVDIIPPSWNIYSVCLSESAEEMIITKIRSKNTPFVLRIPLKRQNLMDRDDESFTFQDAHKELQDIIDLANHSSQSAGDLSRRGAKTEWWDARSALDARLKDLLNNIEGIWLGGFRGIFSHHSAKLDLLSRFQRSLQNILDKYLPSRQKSGKGKQAGYITLNPQVLELFVGLGCPSDTNDVDEPVMDLLYFVVDILQFNGERNAYDEIGFDSIVIETLDALRQYHQAVQKEEQEEFKQHTILILDKHFHCFPWESLPCMRGQSISRLPSLACLRKRILQQKQQKPQVSNLLSAEHGLRVGQRKGAFVLNPAGDLTNTQAKFEDSLQDLLFWEGIIQREPQEAEMRGYLENYDIFLYFGHGSGAQYIRSRTVKKLDKCAVALLMGCSSGTLTEAGDFEPYGTPINYMHAGCPALLATLWDVTDKDIDRFSQTVLEKWGLLKKQEQSMLSSPVKKNRKQKGKEKKIEVTELKDDIKGSLSLTEAVAQSRDSCILEYLNGAAPVVYGVPVFLG